MMTTEHEGLYSEYRITFILYVLANKSFHFESDIIYGTPSVCSSVSCSQIPSIYVLLLGKRPSFTCIQKNIAYFPKVGLCDLLPICVSVSPPIAARQQGLLFDKRKNWPFSVGTLTERSSGLICSQMETEYCLC
jgi:hypothetical protein